MIISIQNTHFAKVMAITVCMYVCMYVSVCLYVCMYICKCMNVCMVCMDWSCVHFILCQSGVKICFSHSLCLLFAYSAERNAVPLTADHGHHGLFVCKRSYMYICMYVCMYIFMYVFTVCVPQQ